MPILSANTRVWLHGLLAAAISAFATAASGILTLPTVFNFSHDGIINMIKVAGVPAMLATFAYLKQSPLPSSSVIGPGDTLSAQKPVIASDGSLSAESATIQKAPSVDPAASPKA